jgi:hypothetical protein
MAALSCLKVISKIYQQNLSRWRRRRSSSSPIGEERILEKGWLDRRLEIVQQSAVYEPNIGIGRYQIWFCLVSLFDKDNARKLGVLRRKDAIMEIVLGFAHQFVTRNNSYFQRKRHICSMSGNRGE